MATNYEAEPLPSTGGTSVAHKLIALLRAPSLIAAAVYAFAGVGFAASNILLARVLPVREFGLVALFLSLTQVGVTLGPFGLELSINRHRLPATWRLLGRAFVTSAIAALVLAAVARYFYGFSLALTWTLAATVLAVTANQIVTTYFQSRERFGLSLFIGLVHAWLLLLAIPLVTMLGNYSALPVALLVLGGYVLITALGWSKRSKTSTDLRGHAVLARGLLLKEGLAAIGMNLALTLLFQLDRLIIPTALSIGDLAIYAVVAAVVGSPFRMLQTGVGYTLLPRLRKADSIARIMRLLRHEAALMLTATSVAAACVLTIGPWLVDVLIPGDYNPPRSVFFAIVVVGFIRVGCGFAQSLISLLGSPRDLFIVNVWAWLAVGEGVVAAFLVRSTGLTGIVYGLGTGWLTFMLAASVLAARALRVWRPGGHAMVNPLGGASV